MPIDPATIDAMVAAGFSAEQMAVVLKSELTAERAAVAAAEEARKARAREGNRERQARYRDRRNENNADNGVTHRDSVTVAENADTSFSELKQGPPSPPKGGSVPQGTTSRKPRNRALPTGWQPGERSDRVRAELGRSAAWMQSTATEMRVWAESTGQVRADWDACHDGWMRREAKREGERPSQRAGPATSPKTHHVALSRLADRLRIPDEPDRTASRFADHGPIIDHASDGPHDRGLFEPAGGDAGQPSEASRLRVVSSRWG